MKKVTLISLLFLLSSTNLFSQSSMQIGLSTGIVTNITAIEDYGLGNLITLNWQSHDRFGIFISSGYLIWREYRTDIHNISAVPLILGAKYYFSSSTFRPYLSAEIEKLWGAFNRGRAEMNGAFFTGDNVLKESDMKNFSGFAVGIGAGFIIKYDETINFEVSFHMNLYAEPTDAFHSRLMIGANYSL